MSSSSSYQPSEDEEASESDIDPRPSSPRTQPNPPPPLIQSPKPYPDPEVKDASELTPRSVSGTRTQTYEKLLLSLKRPSVEAYSSILAQMPDELAPGPAGIDFGSYNDSQNGAVVWTGKEKEVFFGVLSRHGKNGVKEIADAIESKSELEVLDFLSLLHRGMERHHLVDSRSRAVALGDIPAASEIGRQCCKKLDKYAELLSLNEQYFGDVAGKRKHRDVWIIDKDKAEEVDKRIEKGDRNESQDVKDANNSSVYLAATFFHIGRWIQLSERLFMNPGDPREEDNWRNVAFADESPSITADALTDFYGLTISIMRRVMHSSIFFARSRLRNMKESAYEASRSVRRRDVNAALDVLGMKRNGFDFWVHLPRRCNLEVSDIRNRKGWQAEYMSYGEVEDVLSKEERVETLNREKFTLRPKRRLPLQNFAIESEGYTNDDIQRPSSRSSSVSSLLESDDEIPVSREDEHAEEVDRRTSSLEEVRLWKALDRPVPADLDIPIKSEDEEEPKTTRRPTAHRKRKEDLVDWRDRTLYRSDWEQYGEGIFDVYEDISEIRRKRRRTDGQGPRTQIPLSLSDSEGDPEESDADIRELDENDQLMDQSHPSDDEPEEIMDIDEDQTRLRPRTGKNTATDEAFEREAEFLNQMLEQDEPVNADGFPGSSDRRIDPSQQTRQQRIKSEPRGNESEEIGIRILGLEPVSRAESV